MVVDIKAYLLILLDGGLHSHGEPGVRPQLYRPGYFYTKETTGFGNNLGHHQVCWFKAARKRIFLEGGTKQCLCSQGRVVKVFWVILLDVGTYLRPGQFWWKS